MNWLSELLRRFRFRKKGAHFDRDLAEEMRLHLDLRAADGEREGLATDAAQRAARLRFGNATRLVERSREAWGWTFLDRLAQDLRYGVRTLAVNPGFTATAVLSLALGIGANTAIFTLIDALMLRSLPVADPLSLVQVEEGGNPDLTNPMWEEMRDRQPGFAGMMAFDSTRFDLTAGGEARYAEGLLVSGGYFQVLGVPAARGRVFTNDDDRHGGGVSGPVAVISHSFWKRHFDGDPNVIGKTLRLNRTAFQVVGVTPEWFTGLNVDKSYDVAVPIGCVTVMQPDSKALSERQQWWLHIWARLSPGQTASIAGQQLQALTPAILAATLPPDADARKGYLGKTFSLEPAGQGISNTGKEYHTALLTLMSIVGLVLLIACANIANLLLARSSTRQREFSVRMAIGAGRARIVRQLMTESLLLALAGSAAGFVLAQWGGRLLVNLLSTAGNPITIDLTPDLRSLAFTGGVAVLTALLFGLAPAIRATRVHARYSLAAEARGARADAGRPGFGKALVAGQIALSTVLLVGAGLFLGTLRNLLTADTGFDRHNVLLVSADLKNSGVPNSDLARTHREILARIRALPGVTAAASSFLMPIGRAGWNGRTIPEGYTPRSPKDTVVFFNAVSPGYFAAMRTPLRLGRDFSERDDLTGPKVIIINESTSRHFFGESRPIGKTIGLPRPGKRGERDDYEIIGVVGDARYNRIDEEPRKTAYLALAQEADPGPGLRYAIRITGPVEAMVAPVRAAVADVRPETALEFRNFETQVNDSLLQPRLVALLSSAFGSLALGLAMVGLYGITAYGVVRRKGEIGIRMALGAQRGAVVWMMLRETILLLAAGTAVGVAAALAGGRFVATLLYGLRSNDPLQLAAAAGLLIVAALIAAWVPARRASRIDPMAALRDE